MEDEVMNVLKVMIVGFLVVLSLVLIETLNTEKATFIATVVDKHYKAERRSVGVGTAVGSNGGVGIVTTNEVDPEDFLLMVKTEKGEIITVSCEPETYYNKALKDVIKCQKNKGKIFGWFVSYKVIE